MNSETTLTDSMRSGGVTLQDVARHLGVHPMTVSRALSGNGRISEATRDNVRRAARELGYRPNLAARSLRQGKHEKMVALFSPYLDSGMGTQKLERIQSLLGAEGFSTPIHSCGFHRQSGPFQAEILASVRAQRPAAIVFSTLLLKPEAIAELRGWIGEGGVAFGYDGDVNLACDSVIFDRQNAGEQAVDHLLKLGHTRIGYAHHSRVDGTDERLIGTERALQKRGLELPPHWILRAAEPIDYEAGGRALAEQFLALPNNERPTAISMVNDLAALAFVAELAHNGVRVPDDVSLVAHDDRPFAAYAAVPLSVITHPTHDIAETVAAQVQSRLSGERTGKPRRQTICGQLIQRASSAPPKIR